MVFLKLFCHLSYNTIAVLIPLTSLLSHCDGGGGKETGERLIIIRFMHVIV